MDLVIDGENSGFLLSGIRDTARFGNLHTNADGVQGAMVLRFENEIGTGLYTPEYSGISIYPNPFSNALSISALEKIISIEINDIAGRKVYISEVNEVYFNLVLYQLSSGIYILKAEFFDFTILNKIIKK